MKTQICMKLLFLGISLGSCACSYGFENKVTHPAITERSIAGSVLDNYLKTQLGMDEGVNSDLQYNVEAYNAWIKWRMEKGGVENPYNTSRTILKWIKAGSNIEDEDNSLLWSIRSRHHFHDPYRNTGLDNKAEHPNYGSYFAWATGIYTDEFDVTGQSAKAWAIEGFAQQEPTPNNQSWIDARDDFYQALTMPNKSWREEDLAETFLDLGCVLHIIEDMGVPAHTRNDFLFAHYRPPLGKGNPLEKHIEDEIKPSGIPARWLEGWTPQAKVFPKLSHYWDVNNYLGQYAGTSPPSNWGLSERTNYQFLSQSTIFRENIIINEETGERTKYYFPHPDVNHTSEHIDTEVYLWGLIPVDYRYISGYDITHLARTKFTQKYAYMSGMTYPTETVAYHTTFDEAVYEDYAKVTIPRTIDYTAGLINYFFRGRLDVEPNWTDPNIVKLIITNDSNNSGIPQTLKGGTFEIYRDDANDTRTKINPAGITFTPQWTPASTLPNDGGLTKLTAQFATPAARVKNYVVVYKGNISENPADPDPNDPNAIAVGIIRCGYEIVAWAESDMGDKYGQVSNVPQGSHFIAIAAGKRHCLALESDGSIKAWGWDKYGQCSNTPTGSDFIAIAAGNYHSIALKSDGSIVVWGDDSLWQITDKPTGNDFVVITAGDYHSLALKSNGTIIGWGGWNDYGECDAPAPDPGTVYTAIAAGTYHSMALQSDGTVKAWGSNNQGQTRIYDGAAGRVHIAVAACASYSFLLRDDQMLITWGNGDWEVEYEIPRYHYRYPDGTDFVTIAAGLYHILALTSDGRILSWGWPTGDFPFDYFYRTVPEGIVFTDDISAGYDFSLSLKAP